MKKIRSIIREIDSSFRRLDIFLVTIKSLVLLMVCYLILFMIGIEPSYAFVPAVVYFVSSIFVENRVDQLKKVESRYALLNEKLRTARDYQYRDSEVLDALEEDIVANLKSVRVSSFFSFFKAGMMILLLMFSVTASLYIASKDMKVIDFNSFVEDAIKRMNREEEQKPEQADFTNGEVSIMQVGDEKIQVEINPVGLDFDFRDVREEGDYEFSTSFPKEVFISSGAAYQNEFTEEQQALIKKYFESKAK